MYFVLLYFAITSTGSNNKSLINSLGIFSLIDETWDFGAKWGTGKIVQPGPDQEEEGRPVNGGDITPELLFGKLLSSGRAAPGTSQTPTQLQRHAFYSTLVTTYLPIYQYLKD